MKRPSVFVGKSRIKGRYGCLPQKLTAAHMTETNKRQHRGNAASALTWLGCFLFRFVSPNAFRKRGFKSSSDCRLCGDRWCIALLLCCATCRNHLQAPEISLRVPESCDFPLSPTTHGNRKDTAANVPLNLSFEGVEEVRVCFLGVCAQYTNESVSHLKWDVHVLCKAPLSLVIFVTSEHMSGSTGWAVSIEYYKHLTLLCSKKGQSRPALNLLPWGGYTRTPIWGRDYWGWMTHAENVFGEVARTFPAFCFSCRRHTSDSKGFFCLRVSWVLIWLHSHVFLITCSTCQFFLCLEIKVGLIAIGD